MVRALVVLELFRRVMKISPDRSIARLRRQLKDVEADAKRIRRKIALLEREKRSRESIDEIVTTQSRQLDDEDPNALTTDTVNAVE